MNKISNHYTRETLLRVYSSFPCRPSRRNKPRRTGVRLYVACFVVTAFSVGKLLDSPNREAVEPVVVARGIDTTRIEVQVVAVGSRVQRGRPVEADRASVVEPRPVPVARGREEDGVTVDARGKATACNTVLVSPL